MKGFTTEDILTLGRMGYTNEDVVKLLKVRLAEPEPKVEEKKEEPKAPETKPEASKLEGKMDELLKLMQTGFIGASEQPKIESTDDILAKIINPRGNAPQGKE